MESLSGWFATNSVVVFALYGQVFFALGVALGVQSLKHTRLHLGRHLRWLAVFGLSHGIVEWGYVFIPIQAAYLTPGSVEALRWLQVLLMLISFVFLFQFGLRTWLGRGPFESPQSTWQATAAVLAVIAMLSALPVPGSHRIGLEIWARYLLAVPGAAAGATGIRMAARDVRLMGLPRIAFWLEVSAWSLGAYALLNLFTPQHHLALAQWTNYAAVERYIGVPVQIWRTLVGGGMLFGIVRSLSVFEIETDRMLRAAQEQKVLAARQELELMHRIAITLGQARDPESAMETVLHLLLPFLRCTRGEVAVRTPANNWRRVASCGDLAEAPGPGGWNAPPLLLRAAAGGEVVVEAIPAGDHGVGIPIRVGSRLLGAVALYGPTPLELSEQDRQVVNSLGNLLGVGLENGRLWSEVRRREAARTEWIARIISAQEDERRRLAHELHDEVIQALALLCRRLDAISGAQDAPPAPPVQQRLEAACQQVEELIAALRNFARDLRPPALDHLGVVAILRRLLADLGERTEIRWDLTVHGAPRRLPRETELGLYRIAQEAVRNVERHAGAGSVCVDLSFAVDGVSLRVTDDGRGFSPAVQEPVSVANASLGLLGMRERAALLGGDLVIHSQPGQGTAVAVTVPV